jgi:hypothetical protein
MEEGLDKGLESGIFRHYYYSQKVVIYELAKQCKIQKDGQYLQKEMVFLDKTHQRMPVRCLFPFTAQHLIGEDVGTEHKIGSFEAFRFLKSNYNLYLSTAYYKNPPSFSFNPDVRKQQLNAFSFGDEPQYKNHWVGCDFFVDFDSPNEKDIKSAYDDALKLKIHLDHYQVPFVLTNSGTKGFHIRIPFEVLPQNLGLQLVTFCKILAENIHERLQLKTMDLGIFDDRRIFKAPYSYDSYSHNICLPLSDEQFLNFDINKMSAKQVLSNVKIFNRGVLMRNNNLPIEQKRANFMEFWRDFR